MASLAIGRLSRELSSLARWSSGRAAQQTCALSSMTTTSAPQLLVTAFGPHKTGAVAKISSIIFESGASIAQTKKIIVDEHFAMLTSVYVPEDAKSTPEQLAETLQSASTTSLLGFPVTVKQVESSAVASEEPAAEQRRLKLELPQRPGVVLAVTELLKDHGCALSAIDAETVARGDELWFELECLVDLPAGLEAARVESDLQYWVAQEAKAKLIFDKWLRPNVAGSLY